MRLNNRNFEIFRVKLQCQKKKKEIMQFPTNQSTFVSNHLSLQLNVDMKRGYLDLFAKSIFFLHPRVRLLR